MGRAITRLRAITCLVGVAALVTAGVAQAPGTPVSPAPGAVVSSSHPVFTWTVPPNEASETIYVAKAPQTTPDGLFFDENVVDFDFLLAMSANGLRAAPCTPAATGGSL